MNYVDNSRSKNGISNSEKIAIVAAKLRISLFVHESLVVMRKIPRSCSQVLCVLRRELSISTPIISRIARSMLNAPK